MLALVYWNGLFSFHFVRWLKSTLYTVFKLSLNNNGCLLVHTCIAHVSHLMTGAESPGAVRKLMALSDKVKPHNPKIPIGKVTVSPVSNRRGPGPTSPRIGSSRPHPVSLTPESTCLGSGPRKQPLRTGKIKHSLYLSNDDIQQHTITIRVYNL